MVLRFIDIRGIIDNHQLNFMLIILGLQLSYCLLQIVRYYKPAMKLISCDTIEI
jgi:hypothetical protein